MTEITNTPGDKKAEVQVTDDFNGGVVFCAVALRVALNQLVAGSHIKAARADLVYAKYAAVLEDALKNQEK